MIINLKILSSIFVALFLASVGGCDGEPDDPGNKFIESFLPVGLRNIKNRGDYSINDPNFNFCEKGFKKTYTIDFNKSKYRGKYSVDWSLGDNGIFSSEINSDTLKIQYEIIQFGKVLHNQIADRNMPCGYHTYISKDEVPEGARHGTQCCTANLSKFKLPIGKTGSPLTLKLTVIEPSTVLVGYDVTLIITPSEL
ncbi:hypothetical protein [Sedimentisphaera salicampi]|uniref:hypothetical protein n=1 Tax=Sedimentisphaera salicampi TaxID=1941349 RepID=UPI000B9C7288|nr:hypothetical protein [Sedimentisphaera salicampi]OXU15450.1 hypothetical protein SMSP1_00931 [Sedimentisphaera salicampi]